jgi:hypothetical protein
MRVDMEKAERIVSFGCSYIFGDEFPDCGIGKFSHLTYPALLAQKYGLEYTSYSERGGSNESIMRKLIDFYMTDYRDTDIVVIGLTYIQRRDFFNSEESRYMSFFPASNEYRLQNLDTLHKHSRSSVKGLIEASNTILEYDTDYEEKHRFQVMMIYLVNFLKQNQIPHMLFFSERGCLSAAIGKLDMKTEFRGINYFDRAFIQFAVDRAKKSDQFDFYPLGHPNEAIHESWAEKIVYWIENDDE